VDVVVIDASVLIGFLDAADPSHATAVELLRTEVEAGSRLLISASAYSETLVRPMQRDLADQIDAALDGLGIGIVAIDRLTARSAAAIRARSPVRLPDALVLATARGQEAKLLTLDKRLRRIAESLGISVPLQDPEPNGNDSQSCQQQDEHE
jgi:predicted nucleic acid-binding protein